MVGADVGGRLLATNVLLTRLKSHPQSAVALSVDRHPDDPARHLSLEPLTRRHERRVRATVPHGHPESLAVADDHVRTPFTRRRHESERHQVSDCDDEAASSMHTLDEGPVVVEAPIRSGVRHERTDAVGAGLERRSR